MKVIKRNFFTRSAFLAITVLLILGFASTGASAMAGTPVSLLNVFYAFNGTDFVRSTSPMDLPVGSGSISQTENPDGSITNSLTNITTYADSGFGVNAGT